MKPLPRATPAAPFCRHQSPKKPSATSLNARRARRRPAICSLGGSMPSAGRRVEELKALLAPRMATELPKGEGTDYTIYPEPLTEPYRTRRFTVGELLYQSIGVPREDKPSRYKQYSRNYQFFGAPVALFFAREKAHGPAQWADIGGYLQTVALLARGFGLHTCPQQAWVSFPPHCACFSEPPRQFDDLFGYGARLRRRGCPDQCLALSARAARPLCDRSRASKTSGFQAFIPCVQAAFTGAPLTPPLCRFPAYSLPSLVLGALGHAGLRRRSLRITSSCLTKAEQRAAVAANQAISLAQAIKSSA